MNTGNADAKLIDEAMETCVQFFRNNRSYEQLDEIQKSRCNINLVSVDVTSLRETVELKHMVYDDIYKSVYITLPIKYITTGERIHPREIKKIRYKMIPMNDTIDLLENMADVFINGNKLAISNISIALFDDYFVLQVPYSCKNANTIDVLIRPSLMEKNAKTNSIVINKSELINKNINGFLAYVDGRLTEKVSLLEYDSYYTYMCNEPVSSSFEICFVRNLVKYGNMAKTDSNYIRLDKKINKFPISAQHILPFKLNDNGRLHNLNLLAKTSNVFKCAEVISTDYDIYYVYEERDIDQTEYHDNYKWYVDNVLKGLNLGNLNNATLLPEFMNAFKLFDKEISLRNYVSEGVKDLITYNYKKLSQSLEYDQELMVIYLRLISDIMKSFILKESDFIKVDKDYLDANTRQDNRSEIIDDSIQSDFPTSMLLFKIPNYDNCHINIYINGLRNHFHSWEGSELGITYIYIMRNRVAEGSVVEIEKFKFGTSAVAMDVVGNGTNVININNAKLTGLVYDNGMYNIAINDKTEFRNDVIISSMEYDKTNDLLKIGTLSTLVNGSVYTIKNLNYVKIFKFETKHKGVDLTLDVSAMNNTTMDTGYYRVYKNGRELPRSVISLSANGDSILLKVKYTIYELIEIEYSPIKYSDMYKLGALPTNNNGEIDLYQYAITNNSLQYFANNNCQYITVNGRKLDYEHYKYQCSQGATVHDLNSRKWYNIINEHHTSMDVVVASLMDTFKKATHLFDKFMVKRMVGGPITDTEDDCIDENIDRVGELYYDLYREFLKQNILNMNDKMPEYIAIKYSGLVDDSKNNSIMIDSMDRQLYWMPLDGSMKHEADLKNILGLYYALLDDMAFVQVIDPDNIPPDIYEKYKELFNNNVLVLQVPSVPPM